MKKRNFLNMLQDVICCANEENKKIKMGQTSNWEATELTEIVLPEMLELLANISKKKPLFKYGKQRQLESTYLITDSLLHLNQTDLGIKILELQRQYYKL